MAGISTLLTNTDQLGILGESFDEVLFRVRGPNAPQVAVVRFMGTKCCIGASEFCSIQLPYPGVSELDCVVLQGVRGVVVRNWSGATLLNGQPFQDSPLN